MSAGELAGQVAVVTGAGRGIGRAIAQTLARAGATVFSLDLAPPDDGGAGGAGGAIRGVVADVADEHAVAEAFAGILAAEGRLDILVNNAGLFSTLERAPFWELDVAEWDRVLAVNVRSVFLCTRAASAPMRAAGAGRVVNLASNSAAFGMGNLLHYVTSKSAIVGMTRSLARELGPFGITVNAIAPGLVTTEQTERAIDAGYRRRIAETQVIPEPVGDDDVAAAVRYLCSPGARLVTGQTLPVNGGATMGPA